MKKTESLLPLRLAAQRIGVKVESLRAAAERGDVPSVRVGDDLLFPAERIVRILAERAMKMGMEVARA
jgi:hypothetical protein